MWVAFSHSKREHHLTFPRFCGANTLASGGSHLEGSGLRSLARRHLQAAPSHVQRGRTEFVDRKHHPCYNTKTKLTSRGDVGKRHPPYDHNPSAKGKTLRSWKGRWTESTDGGPASENDRFCVIMGDRRLSRGGEREAS